MNQEQFKNKTNEILILSLDSQTTALFSQDMQTLINQLEREQAQGGDPVFIAGQLGRLHGILLIQEKWLQGQVIAKYDEQIRQSAGVKWLI